MKDRILIALVALAIMLPSLAWARKSTYIVTDRRLNYVKVVEVKPVVAQERGMSHPIDISEQKVRDVLSSLVLSKGQILSEKEHERRVFDDYSVGYLAAPISQAFRQAKSNEEVQFSFVVKDPKFILRDDRLTMVTAWVSKGELYLQFDKLYAKLTGDTDKRGDYSKQVSRARGTRVHFQLSPGQQMASVGSDTLIIDLAHDFAPVTSSAFAAEDAAVEKDAPKRSRRSKYEKDKAADVSSAEAAVPAAASAASAEQNVTRRLEELDMLRKRNLITRKDYEEKKKEILNEL